MVKKQLCSPNLESSHSMINDIIAFEERKSPPNRRGKERTFKHCEGEKRKGFSRRHPLLWQLPQIQIDRDLRGWNRQTRPPFSLTPGLVYDTTANAESRFYPGKDK
ncbi:hypothetical protein NPIL_245831 [Nephila pilipes]|uniref:Uncharacterized protein n=1 Tax=Nephila pilipes TaxID=299642 RepID=A0A8X6IGE1_NEPPI|nr:hypothetical protein NPIL_245831 [Nephila pilipes]